MPRRARPGLPVRVKQLLDRIEHWRRTRERRTAMPAEWWSEAVILARTEGAYPIARVLRINFEGLKRRMAEEAAGPPSVPRGFVELSGAQIAPSTGTVVEMEDGGGMRLVMRLGKDALVDVAEVVAVFRGRGA